MSVHDIESSLLGSWTFNISYAAVLSTALMLLLDFMAKVTIFVRQKSPFFFIAFLIITYGLILIYQVGFVDGSLPMIKLLLFPLTWQTHFADINCSMLYMLLAGTRLYGCHSIKSNSNVPVKDTNGHVITKIEEQFKRWKEHFEEVLNRPT